MVVRFFFASRTLEPYVHNYLFVLLGSEVVNFELDFMDSTVFACLLSSYCPFLIESHLKRLHSEPTSPEECSHNAIILVDALKHAGLEYDIQPNDICSPNPVSVILFCSFLYKRLRFFKPKNTLNFETILNSSVSQQVSISSSLKSLNATLPMCYGSLLQFVDNVIIIHITLGQMQN